MAVDFADVTDVAIPEGDVERITETVTGNVLWEKNLAPKAQWISKTLASDYGIFNLSFDTKPIIQCLSKDTFINSTSRFGLRMGVSPQTGLSYLPNAYSFSAFIRTENKGSSWIHTDKPNADTSYISYYMATSRVLEISDDGLIDLFYTKDINNINTGYWLCDTRKQRSGGTSNTGLGAAIKVDTPISEDNVGIIHSASRKEYLVTGIKKGSFTIPESFSGKTTQSNYSNKKLQGACWCSRDNLYYGAVTDNTGYIAYSSDGYSWTDVKVFSSDSVVGVADLSTSNKLVAFANNKVAVSTNGKNWTQKGVPFTSVAGYAYSSDYDLLCVADNSGKVYITKNLEHWQTIEAPANVKFKDFVYLKFGFFAGIGYKADRVYILNTQQVLA